MSVSSDYPTQRESIESHFTTSDQQRLFFRYWPSATAEKKAIVLFHRGHEHSGRVAHLADELALPDFAVFAWDARGHGRNDGPRGYSPSMGTSISDINEFINFISSEYEIPIENMVVLGQSVGAVTLTGWVHDFAPKIRGQTLCAVCPQRTGADAENSRAVLCKLLCQSQISHPRPATYRFI